MARRNRITEKDLKLQFSKEEAVQYGTVVENIRTEPTQIHGNMYPAMYINWLQEKLLEEWNKSE